MDEILILVLQLQKLHIYKVVGATKEGPDCSEESCPRLFRGVLINSGRTGINSLERELESSELHWMRRSNSVRERAQQLLRQSSISTASLSSLNAKDSEAAKVK